MQASRMAFVQPLGPGGRRTPQRLAPELDDFDRSDAGQESVPIFKARPQRCGDHQGLAGVCGTTVQPGRVWVGDAVWLDSSLSDRS